MENLHQEKTVTSNGTTKHGQSSGESKKSKKLCVRKNFRTPNEAQQTEDENENIGKMTSKVILPRIDKVEDAEVDVMVYSTPEGELSSDMSGPAIDEVVEIKEPMPLANEDANTSRSVLSESTTYKVEAYSKNSMIIFNHSKVIGHEDRLGTEKDVDALKKTFSKLAFNDITVYDDLDYRGIQKAMDEYSSTDFTQSGCVMVVVLTHGDTNGYIYAKDRKYLEKELFEHFLKNENPSLTDKPKVFLLQTCRGNTASKAVTVRTAGPSPRHSANDSNEYTIPSESGFLIFRSTFEGTVSHRDVDSGSWFIQALCKNVDAYAGTMDLAKIMTETNRDIAINKERRVIGATYVHKQMPVVQSTLIGNIFFKKPDDVASPREIQIEGVSSTDDLSESNSPSTIDCGRVVLPKQHFLHMRNFLQRFHQEEPIEVNTNLLNVANSLDENVVSDVTLDLTAREISDHLKRHAAHWNLFNLILFL